jgi:phosphorylcholine metabolism protein LicD
MEDEQVNYKEDKLIYVIFFLIITGIIIYYYTLDNNQWYNEISDKLTKEEKDNLKLGQQKMTEMLRYFDKICRKHDLKYWVCGGTLIGASRHKGWIPHDADIDVCMTDSDFRILEGNIQNELPSEMWFQSINTDPLYTCPPPLLGKIRNLSYCYIDCGDRKWHNGIQLDIFVYTENNGILDIVPHSHGIFPMKYDGVFPLKELTFEGINVYVQNNYIDFLKEVWGGYPPPELPMKDRYPHEGRIGKTQNWIKDKYPLLYNYHKFHHP